jgi:hypothetical protein
VQIPPFEVHRPLVFEFDPGTGLTTMVLAIKMRQVDFAPFDVSMRVLLTPEIARSLLVYLPELQNLLEQATKPQAKPNFLQ